jgi:hypothetical protein
MYPAIEITLHLDHIYAAQRWSPATLESASRDLHGGTNLLPSTQLVRISTLRGHAADLAAIRDALVRPRGGFPPGHRWWRVPGRHAAILPCLGLAER